MNLYIKIIICAIALFLFGCGDSASEPEEFTLTLDEAEEDVTPSETGEDTGTEDDEELERSGADTAGDLDIVESGSDAGTDVATEEATEDTEETTEDTEEATEDTDEATEDTEEATEDTESPETAGCQSDKDCKAESQFCDPLFGQCVDCLFDIHCEGNARCVEQECVEYTSCTNSLDCFDLPEQPICAADIGQCVECNGAEDCEGTADCILNSCVSFVACVNSLDCPDDEVCDNATGRCVICLGDNDCGQDEACMEGQCLSFVPCDSDKDCTSDGKLCDKELGKCTACLSNSDCPEEYHCAAKISGWVNECVIDICAPDQGACQGNSLVSCNEIGDAYAAPVACGAEETCAVQGVAAVCEAWLCSPGLSCDGSVATECSENGLSIISSTDCALSLLNCFNGECLAQVCTPGQDFCDQNSVVNCSDDGLSYLTVEDCGESNFCNQAATSAACQPKVCEPDAIFCDGNTVKSCDSIGSAATIVEDCGAQGKGCAGGECDICPSGWTGENCDTFSTLELFALKHTGKAPEGDGKRWTADNNALITTIQNVSSAGECAQHCLDESACIGFTYKFNGSWADEAPYLQDEACGLFKSLVAGSTGVPNIHSYEFTGELSGGGDDSSQLWKIQFESTISNHLPRYSTVQWLNSDGTYLQASQVDISNASFSDSKGCESMADAMLGTCLVENCTDDGWIFTGGEIIFEFANSYDFEGFRAWFTPGPSGKNMWGIVSIWHYDQDAGSWKKMQDITMNAQTGTACGWLTYSFSGSGSGSEDPEPATALDSFALMHTGSGGNGQRWTDNNSLLQVITGVDTALDCAQHCQNNSECIGFTYKFNGSWDGDNLQYLDDKGCGLFSDVNAISTSVPDISSYVRLDCANSWSGDFGSTTYTYCPQVMTRESADWVCKGNNGQLAKIVSSEANSYVRDSVQSAGFNSALEGMWIGLTSNGGNYVWEDGTGITWSIPWTPDSPEANENCVIMMISGVTGWDGLWKTVPCGIKKPFACSQ